MNKHIIGNYIIDVDALEWANMAHQWNTEKRHYRIDAANGLSALDNADLITHTGIYVRFTDGSNLIFDDSDPATAQLRAILTGTAQPEPSTGDYLPGFNPAENAIIAGLPQELQDAILQGGM